MTDTGATPGEDLVRSAAGITLWNLASRITGFVRVVMIGGALGATYLGNTYQSANLVSNLLFELLAAGMLGAVLVPALVGRLSADDRDGARHLAGGILGRALLLLTPVVVLGAVAAPWLMRALTTGVADESVRDAQIRLGSFLLVFFLPQVLLYAVGAVTTALLQAESRFVAAAAAPVANNVVVSVTLAWFWARGGAGLELGTTDRLLLAAGTTAGVLAMTLLPAVAAARSGLGVRPHLRALPGVATLARRGGWAVATLAVMQALVFVTVVLANRVEGGVVAYQVAFTLFLLPHALFAHPVATALLPRLSAHAHEGDTEALRVGANGGIRLLVLTLLPVSALLVALAPVGVAAISFGALDRGAGPALVASALEAYGPGLIGYSALLLLTRMAYAVDDARTPGIVTGVAVGLGIALMLVLSVASDGTDRVRVLGIAHSATMLGAAAALGFSLFRRGLLEPRWPAWARTAIWAIACGLAARLVADAATSGAHHRGSAVAATMLGAVAGVIVYALGQCLTGTDLRGLLPRRRLS